MTYDKNTFVVGGKVIVLNYEDLTRRHKWTWYDAVVTKVGRAYVHVILAGDWNLKFSLETGMCDGRYIVFPNRNAYIDYHNTYSLRPIVRRELDKQYKTLSFDKLTQIAEVLEIDWKKVIPCDQ